jgi:predicted HAD superfamily Cof-like phosphohydrolase
MSYQEPQALNSVADFHELFGAPILSKPTIPDAERCTLRVSLLQEELDELKQAIADGDLVEIADALGDIQYVLAGAVHEFGLGDRFADIFGEIQRSNMSKACTTLEEAEKTVKHYKIYKGEEAYIVEKD